MTIAITQQWRIYTDSSLKSSVRIPPKHPDQQVVDWTTNSVTLTWDEVPGENIYYKVEYQRPNDVRVDRDFQSTTATVTELKPDTNYQFHVIAINANGKSTPSNWVSAKTNVVYPCNPNPCANNGTCAVQGDEIVFDLSMQLTQKR